MSGAGRPDWQHPGRRATIPVHAPAGEGTNRASRGSSRGRGRTTSRSGRAATTPTTPTGRAASAAPPRTTTPTRRTTAGTAGRPSAVSRRRRSGWPRALNRTSSRGAPPRREPRLPRSANGTRETQRLKDDHAKSVDASTRLAKEATEARDAAWKSLAEHPVAVEAATLAAVNAERDVAETAAKELEATLREVREEAAANLDALRAMHARECQPDENLVAANDLTRKVVRDLADSKTARDALESEVRRVNERVKAVEDEFRWALKESEEDKTRLTAEVEEMTRVGSSRLSDARGTPRFCRGVAMEQFASSRGSP